MPDPLTPEDRRVLAAQIEEGRQVSPYSGARLLAALAAAEAERDAAREALHAAGVCVAALDVMALDPDRIDVGEVARLVTVANRFISDDLRDQVGQPCIEGDTLAALLARSPRPPGERADV